jgi:tetratricopeptide (TPR) repeat protein
VFWRKKPYDRGQVLATADRARTRGQYRKAIQGYRQILKVNPSDLSVLGKLAPLLVHARQRAEALSCFQRAAQGHFLAGFADRAAAVYAQAAGFFPQEAPLWEEMARLEQLRGRRADAVNALVAGSGHVGRRARLRGRAIQMLEEALRIEPWHLEATLALARLLARQGDRAAGMTCLEDLASRVRGRGLRRVRWAMVRLAPTPGHGWRWLKSVMGSR